MLERGITVADLAKAVKISAKTVERWITQDREPYARHRFATATFLGLSERDLWPNASSAKQVNEASQSELVTLYPQLSAVGWDSWVRLFEGAKREIGILVYDDLFPLEDSAIRKILTEKARAGVRVRILFEDPESDEAARRESAAERIRDALAMCRPLCDIDGVELRLHTSPFGSIYRADNELLVNTPMYGLAPTRAPVLHLRRTAGGETVATYLESFERVWNDAIPTSE